MTDDSNPRRPTENPNPPKEGADGPTGWLQRYAEKNPQQAALIMGGVAAFVGLAIITSYGINPEDRIRPVAYLLFVGVFVAIATAILRDALIMNILKWCVVFVFVAWLAGFALHRAMPDNQPLACFANFLSECRITTDRIAEQSNPPPPAATPAQPAPPTAADYSVFVQFAGSLDRDDVRAVMRRLRDAGWRVQGVEGGGERTARAAGLAEVRYLETRDEPIARALAVALNATKLITKEIKPSQNPLIKKGTLEVWISR